MPSNNTTQRDIFLTEICQSGEALNATADSLRRQAVALEKSRDFLEGKRLILTGMGSSADAVAGLASVLGRHGRESSVVNTAELLHFRIPSISDEHALVIVSQSGLSVEAVKLITKMREERTIPVLVVTNSGQNPLSEAASVSLTLNAGEEVGPSSKTYVSTMFMMHVLAELLATNASVEDIITKAQDMAHAAARALEPWMSKAEPIGQELGEWITSCKSLFIVGRGASATAAELNALVLKESAHVPAQSMDSAEFRHGPLELAAPGLGVVLMCVEPTVAHLDARLRNDLLARGAHVVTIGVDQCASEDLPIDHVIDTHDPLVDAGLVALPLLLAAWAEAARRSQTPGVFSVGAKVTTCE